MVVMSSQLAPVLQQQAQQILSNDKTNSIQMQQIKAVQQQNQQQQHQQNQVILQQVSNTG